LRAGCFCLGSQLFSSTHSFLRFRELFRVMLSAGARRFNFGAFACCLLGGQLKFLFFLTQQLDLKALPFLRGGNIAFSG
jgi:hypothetical protein